MGSHDDFRFKNLEWVPRLKPRNTEENAMINFQTDGSDKGRLAGKSSVHRFRSRIICGLWEMISLLFW